MLWARAGHASCVPACDAHIIVGRHACAGVRLLAQSDVPPLMLSPPPQPMYEMRGAPPAKREQPPSWLAKVRGSTGLGSLRRLR